ncbi:hypothetical protein CORC01_12336 [Colletotrichum orchidophilum]|uniref:Uncharacterized protein n=1 Tax=Colletotrichum orchidophilum TaxID=1209926 RepID=A0A1G4ATB0_9PEZI|nr:uncharacterized protein CORC01_12336 [Colletotrichum orchidophilum]OHE92341.1 hypothetical protein CORC01_12336 [Colletotrichum orchidophilum]
MQTRTRCMELGRREPWLLPKRIEIGTGSTSPHRTSPWSIPGAPRMQLQPPHVRTIGADHLALPARLCHVHSLSTAAWLIAPMPPGNSRWLQQHLENLPE